MKIAKIVIKTRPNSWGKIVLRSVPAYLSPDFPGLAVHRGIDWLHDIWNVVHIRSQWRVNQLAFNKRKQAVVYAQEIAKLADWSQSGDDIVAQGVARRIMASKALEKAMRA